ncbi:MAG: hypothetical protein J6033_02055 [Lachnospiraceae bacterium]|nr:hypothetical protein [Lachnospiraceae bacterium]
MNKQEFAKKMAEMVGESLGEGYEVFAKQVRKNNGVLYDGVVITKKGSNLSPTIYVEKLLEEYENGTSLDDLAKMLISIYENDTFSLNVDMEFFKDFASVKDSICYKLISVEKNEELLKTIPYSEVLDLAKVYYYVYNDMRLGKGYILIHNVHLKNWGITPEELDKAATENTPVLNEWKCESLDNVIIKLFKDKGFSMEEIEMQLKEKPEGTKMFVLTNTEDFLGASTILYPGVLSRISEEYMEGDFYILPCSIHEVILLRTGNSFDESEREYMRNLVADVNSTSLELCDILSDSIYFYDSKEEKLTVA